MSALRPRNLVPFMFGHGTWFGKRASVRYTIREKREYTHIVRQALANKTLESVPDHLLTDDFVLVAVAYGESELVDQLMVRRLLASTPRVIATLQAVGWDDLAYELHGTSRFSDTPLRPLGDGPTVDSQCGLRVTVVQENGLKFTAPLARMACVGPCATRPAVQIGIPYCEACRRSELGVSVRASGVEGAGLGLYAYAPPPAGPDTLVFTPGAHIVWYDGSEDMVLCEAIDQTELERRYGTGDGTSAPYVVPRSIDRMFLDGAITRMVGALANTRLDPAACNAEFVEDVTVRRVWVRATKEIMNGDEIFVDYNLPTSNRSPFPPVVHTDPDPTLVLPDAAVLYTPSTDASDSDSSESSEYVPHSRVRGVGTGAPRARRGARNLGRADEHTRQMLRLGVDNTGLMEIVTIPGKGRGIRAKRDIAKGEYVCEYTGDIITKAEGEAREDAMRAAATADATPMCYMYYFQYGGVWYCVDATAESERPARLINHSRRHPNLTTTAYDVNEPTQRDYRPDPRLALKASRDIKMGEELLFDYGERDPDVIAANPWLNE